jgi:hypothetical protein
LEHGHGNRRSPIRHDRLSDRDAGASFVDLSAALAADLAALTDLLDSSQPEDLESSLLGLIADLSATVESYVGVRMTLTLDGNEVSFGVGRVSGPDVATSLRVPLTPLAGAPNGSALVVFASRPGALVDLAADLSFALGIEMTELALDADLVAEPDAADADAGMVGLRELSVINQAIGVLVTRGHTPETARAELHRLAQLDSGVMLHAANAVLASIQLPPAPGQLSDGPGRHG